ncbi:MAG: hypothetical protein U0O04_03700 [Clostridia bacterium]|jgi:hypothetical protein
MLRIKKDVDLIKAWKDFNFIKDDERGKLHNKSGTLTINMWNRKIIFTPYNTLDDDETVIILYDLIQAGLVEKVEEE